MPLSDRPDVPRVLRPRLVRERGARLGLIALATKRIAQADAMEGVTGSDGTRKRLDGIVRPLAVEPLVRDINATAELQPADGVLGIDAIDIGAAPRVGGGLVA